MQVFRTAAGKAPWSCGAEMLCRTGPRYGQKVRAEARIQVEPRTILFALSLSAQGVFCCREIFYGTAGKKETFLVHLAILSLTGMAERKAIFPIRCQ